MIGPHEIVGLTGGQEKAGWVAERINQGVDFGAKGLLINKRIAILSF